MGVPIKTWLYFIADFQNRTARVENGVVKMLGGDPVPLPENPSGWREIQVGLGTNAAYFSLNRNFSVPLTFVGDGATIIRKYMYGGKGYEEELYLIILKWDPSDGVYKLEYKGKLDIPKQTDQLLNGVLVNSMEGGVVGYVNANDGQTYEFDNTVNNPKCIPVLFDGMNFAQRYNYVYGAGTDASEFIMDGDTDFLHVFPSVLQNAEGIDFDTVKSDSIVPEYLSFADILPYVQQSNNYILYRPYAFQVTTGGQIKWALASGPGSFHVDIYYYTSLGNRYDVVLNHLVGGTFVNPEIIPIPVMNINLAENEKIFLFVQRIEGGGGLFRIGIFEGTKITYDFVTSNQPSVAYAWRPLDMLKALIEKMSDGKCTADSVHLAAHNNQVIIGGESLANITDAVAKVMFKDFFAHYDVEYSMGLTVVNGVLYMEKLDTLYAEGAEIMDIGEISAVRVQYAEDRICNSGKFGYKKQDYRQGDGRYEVNGTTEWKFPVSSVKREFNKVSPWRTDPTGIELVRKTSFSAQPVDDRSDNQIFVVNISANQDANGNFLLNRVNYDVINGVIDNTIYNVEEMTPARIARAHASVIKSLLIQLPGTQLTYNTSDRNSNLVTTKDGITIAESGNIQVGAMGAPLFLPYYLLFELKVPLNFISIFSAFNAGGHIKATYLGNELYLLPIGEMSSKPASQEVQEWKLLISPKTPLSTLNSLSLEGFFTTDAMNNTIFVSDLNPVHFTKYGYVTPAQFHHKEIYDARFERRNDRFTEQPEYLQKWQKTDSIKLQFVTAGYGALTLKVFDAKGYQIEIKAFDIVAEAAVKLPYVLQQIEIDLSTYAEGIIGMSVYADPEVPLLLSEWMEVAEDWPETYRLDYWNTNNKFSAYFAAWRPCIRVEANFMPIDPDADFTDYEDELKDLEMLEGRPFDRRDLIVGAGNGIPDWMARKIRFMLLLNRCAVEGDYWTRSPQSKFEKANAVPGWPMYYYLIQVWPTRANTGLSITPDSVPNDDTISYTLDAAALGRGAGLINIEAKNNP